MLAVAPTNRQSKQVHAVLAVVPISEWYIAAVRSFAPNDGKRHPTLIAIDSAEAIAAEPSSKNSAPKLKRTSLYLAGHFI
jgi:hypothetical protein